MASMARAAAAAMLAMSLNAATSDRFLGAQACSACHAAEFASQSASAHAGALSRVSAPSFPAGNLLRGPRYRYQILFSDLGLHVRIDHGVDVIDLPLE